MSSVCSRTDSMSSRRPARMPDPCGPRIAFPPLNATSAAPSSTKARRFDDGGSSAAPSTITGTPRAAASSHTRSSDTPSFVGEREMPTATVRSQKASSSLPLVRQPDALHVRVADLDDPRARGSERAVIRIAVPSLNDDLGGQATGRRQPIEVGPSVPGDASSGGERHRGGRASRHPARLGSRRLRDHLAGPRLQLVRAIGRGRRLVHREPDRLGQRAAAERSREAGRADQAGHGNRLGVHFALRSCGRRTTR